MGHRLLFLVPKLSFFATPTWVVLIKVISCTCITTAARRAANVISTSFWIPASLMLSSYGRISAPQLGWPSKSSRYGLQNSWYVTTAVVGELVMVVVLFALFHCCILLSKSNMTPLMLTREDIVHAAFMSDTSIPTRLGFAESVMCGCVILGYLWLIASSCGTKSEVDKKIN